MVDNTKKKANISQYTVNQVIDNLSKVIKDNGHDVDYVTAKYHIDVGLLVNFAVEKMPDFSLGSNWIQDQTGIDWLLYAIEPMDDKKGYNVIFLLEEEI